MVTIRLFASLKELAGVGCLLLKAEPETTTHDLFRDLVQRFPKLAGYEKSLLVAINEEYARLGAPVEDGDEVAFFPPVSGG